MRVNRFFFEYMESSFSSSTQVKTILAPILPAYQFELMVINFSKVCAQPAWLLYKKGTIFWCT